MNQAEVIVDQRKTGLKRRGRIAEKEVQGILDQLPKGRYAVFNNLPAQYGNIDHLVISREGAVFLIETKSHRGTVTFDGKQLLLNRKPFKQNPICQMNRNIRWLRRMTMNTFGMNCWFAAIPAFPNAEASVGQSVMWVNVCDAKCLLKSINSYQSMVV